MAPRLVSIIINNYNYGRFLRQSIDSALKQTYQHIEVVVVDDGSTDDSPEIIRSYGNKIVPVLKANGGQASAFNAGFAVSQGDIICFLDSDDIFAHEKVAEVVNIFKSYEDIGWCYHSLQLLNDSSGEFIRNRYQWLPGEYDLRPLISKGKLNKFHSFPPPTSGLCFERSLLQKILPMPEAITIVSDNYLKFTAISLSKGFASSQDLAIQRIHSNNAYTLRKDKQQLSARIHVLTSYWMLMKFPNLKKFANNSFAIGLGTFWRVGSIEAESQEIVEDYLSSVLFQEKLDILIRAFYHYLKL